MTSVPDGPYVPNPVHVTNISKGINESQETLIFFQQIRHSRTTFTENLNILTLFTLYYISYLLTPKTNLIVTFCICRVVINLSPTIFRLCQKIVILKLFRDYNFSAIMVEVQIKKIKFCLNLFLFYLLVIYYHTQRN